MKKLALMIVCAFCLLSCGPEYYKTAGYESRATEHQILAVLPVETVTTGRIPRDLTDEDIEEIENAESRAFQISLFNQIAKRTGRYSGTIQVDIQHYTQTNAKLEEAGISPRESWRMSPEKLAEIIGVDGVIRTAVHKDRYLTNLESYGISVAATILSAFTNGWWWAYPSARTSDMFISCAILNGDDGVPVWSTDFDCRTFWNRRTHDVIDDVSRRIGRRFPYRD